MKFYQFALVLLIFSIGLGPAMAQTAIGCANDKGCQQRDYEVAKGVEALLQAVACPGQTQGELAVNAGFRISAANDAARKCIRVMGVFPAARRTWNVSVHNDDGPECRTAAVSVYTICVWPGEAPKSEPMK